MSLTKSFKRFKAKEFVFSLVFFLFLLNLASIIYLKVKTGGWPYLSNEYAHKKYGLIKMFIDHNYPHPFLGYTRTNINNPSNSELDRNLFWDVFETKKFTSEDPTILVLGGSVAMHLSNNSSEHERDFKFGKQALANQILEFFPNANFRIINAAYAGKKQPQQYMTVVYLDLLGVKFDMVINLDGFNEIALPVTENFHKNLPAIFPRSYDRMVNAFANSKCLDVHLDRKDRLSPLPFLELIDYKKLKSCRYSFLHPENPKLIFEDVKIKMSDFIDSAVDIWAVSSNKMAKFLKSKDVIYLHTIQPNQYYKESKKFSSEEKTNMMSHEGFENAIGKYYEKIDVSLLQVNLVADLRDVFKDEMRTVYRDDCCHFNDLGMKLISREIINSFHTEFETIFNESTSS